MFCNIKVKMILIFIITSTIIFASSSANTYTTFSSSPLPSSWPELQIHLIEIVKKINDENKVQIHQEMKDIVKQSCGSVRTIDQLQIVEFAESASVKLPKSVQNVAKFYIFSILNDFNKCT